MFVYLPSKKSNFDKLVMIDLPFKETQLFTVNIAQVSVNFLNKICLVQLLKNNDSLLVLGVVQRNITSKFFLNNL